jgi:uncharacterized RDD family membrane protein YckC
MIIEAPSLPRRLACWLYEGMIMFGVVFVAGYLFGSLTQTKHGLDNRHALQAFLFVVFGIYFGWFWNKGQTIAMKAWHIKLVDAKGQTVTQARAVGRYLLSWLWLLPPLAAASITRLSVAEVSVLVFGWVAIYAVLARFAPGKQFWHDVLAGTRLIDAKPGDAPPALK